MKTLSSELSVGNLHSKSFSLLRSSLFLKNALPVVAFMLCAVFSGGASQTISCWPSRPIDLNITMYPCFGTLCRCNSSTANCSGNGGRLQFVPQFRFVVKVLNFSNNGLREITRDDFFLNVSQVTLLDLYNNGLEFISGGAFRVLQNLTMLLIGGNKLSFLALSPVFSIPTLNTLEIMCGGFASIPQDVFANSSMLELTHLRLGWNSIHQLQMKVLQPLSRLVTFSLWHNKISYLETDRMLHLEYLNFHHNELDKFPKTCQEDTNESFFPKLTTLNLQYNLISSIQNPVCLPRLQNLNLQYNYFEHYPSGGFNLSRFPSLKSLQIFQMEDATKTMSSFAFNNSKLRSISLTWNSIDFSMDAVDSDVFGGCVSVTQLNLDHNSFQYVSDDKFRQLFRHLKSLKTLYLGNNKIENIPLNISSVLFNVEHLSLGSNSIETIPDGVFDLMLQLKYLDLSDNRLPQLTSQTFSEGTRDRLQYLDLSSNPFRCDCEILWFQQWLRTDVSLFESKWNTAYDCDKLNQSVQNFYLSTQACMISTDAAFGITCITSFLMAVLVVVAVFFRFRWHIRLLVYEAFRHKNLHQEEARHFPYDVFVGYASEDIQWVTQELLPVLEGRWNLRACVHQRDFLPGKHIVDNIADSVQDSHKILMVFSPDFARSEWCQFELKYCQSNVMDRDDVLIIVILQETQSRDMTAAMLALLRTITYIQWSEEPDAKTSFWGRMQLSFNEILQRNVP